MENNISFGASFIRKLPVLKYSYESKLYNPASVDMVELNPLDLRDIKALNSIAKDFGGDSFVNNVYVEAKIAYNNSEQSCDDMGILALTRQRDNFEELNPYDVLGVAEISKFGNGEIELEYLQVHPQYIYSYGPPYIKRIGTTIINYLKDTYNTIKLNATSSATLFYIKNGFTRAKANTNKFIWRKQD